MKKYVTEKNFRRLAAAATALLLLAALVPTAMAKYVDGYIPNVANVNSELSEVSQTQADNMFIALMNRMYPVGSVYMTTAADLDTVGKMESHFGGKWVRWGQGTVPVGSGAALGAASMDGLANVDVKVSGVAVNVPALTAGGVSLGTPNTVTWDADVTGWNYTHNGTHSETMSETEMPAHDHNPVATKGLYSESVSKGTSSGTTWGDGGSGTLTAVRMTVGDVTNGTSTTALSPIGQAFDVKTSFPLSTSSIIPTINGRSGTVNGQGLDKDGTTQSVGTNTLKAEGSGTIANVTDATVQPYITCYMYERKVLADLR